jgi:mannose-6-phosphate isomerase-like protein (cupin superfamily)
MRSPPARPFALEPGAGERIWFTNTEMTIKATAAATDGHLCLIETYAPAGHGPPMHVHHDEHEAFYVLEGELEVACGDERYRAPAGSFAFLPRGIAHNLPRRGRRPGAPAHLRPARRHGGLLPGRRPPGPTVPGLPPGGPVDIALLKRVSERYNAEIIGPPLSD